MKKTFCFCLMVFISLFYLQGCKQNGPTRIIQSKRCHVINLYEPENIDDWEKHVDCVVKGTLKNDSQEVLRESDIELWDGSTSSVTTGGWTVSTLDITGVIKGDFKVGDTIRLDEPFFTKKAEGETDIFIDGFYPALYVPAEKGKEYIFFLDYMDESHGRLADTYAVATKVYNRFPVVSTNTRSAEADLLTQNMTDTELEALGSDETYQDFYQQAIDKYMK